MLPAAAWRTIPTRIVAKQLRGSKFYMGQKYAPCSCLTMVFKMYAKQLQEACFCPVWNFNPCSCLARVCAGIDRQAAAGSKNAPKVGAERPAVADTAFVCLRKCAPFSSEGKNSIASLRRMHFSLGNSGIYKNGVCGSADEQHVSLRRMHFSLGNNAYYEKGLAKVDPSSKLCFADTTIP